MNKALIETSVHFITIRDGIWSQFRAVVLSLEAKVTKVKLSVIQSQNLRIWKTPPPHTHTHNLETSAVSKKWPACVSIALWWGDDSSGRESALVISVIRLIVFNSDPLDFSHLIYSFICIFFWKSKYSIHVEKHTKFTCMVQNIINEHLCIASQIR